jgi:protein SCO1/2
MRAPLLLAAALGLSSARADEPHAPCHAAAAAPSSARTTASYRIPDVTLVRADGARVRFRRELDDGKPVILDFVFTTCAAICPLMSRGFAEIQRRLGARGGVHLISISIDPEHDTPARLTEYARRFRAGPAWSFYTGTVEASQALQRAFDAWRGDTMNHAPITFVRAAPDAPWVRLEGFTDPDAVIGELR